MSTMRFSHIELKNWQNFVAVDVDLASRVFIVGPNAIGKSNLLQAFRFLRNLVLDGGGLASAVKDRGGMAKLRSLHARGVDSDVSIAVDVLDRDGSGWRYELSFSHDRKTDRPVVVREIVDRIRPDAAPENVLKRPDALDLDDRERLVQTAIQQTSANKKFRPLAEFFSTVSYLHLVPQLLREEQKPRADRIGPDPFGRDLLDQMRNTPERKRRGRLKRIEKVLKAVVPELQNLRLETDDHGRPHLEGKFQHWRPQGAYQDERQLSDGTLRLIGLLWALQESGAPLLLEEPELSLHTAIIRRMAPFIGRAQKAGEGRQVIITTHSEALLMDPGIAADEVLLLEPANEGARVVAGATHPRISRLMQHGITAGEAVLPRTESQQMSLFDELAV